MAPRSGETYMQALTLVHLLPPRHQVCILLPLPPPLLPLLPPHGSALRGGLEGLVCRGVPFVHAHRGGLQHRHVARPHEHGKHVAAAEAVVCKSRACAQRVQIPLALLLRHLVQALREGLQVEGKGG